MVSASSWRCSDTGATRRGATRGDPGPEARGTLVVTEPKERFDINVILDRCELRLRRTGLLETLRGDMDRVNTANLQLDPSHRPSRSPLRAEGVAETLRSTGFAHVSFRDSHFRQCATVVGTKPPS